MGMLLYLLQAATVICIPWSTGRSSGTLRVVGRNGDELCTQCGDRGQNGLQPAGPDCSRGTTRRNRTSLPAPLGKEFLRGHFTSARVLQRKLRSTIARRESTPRGARGDELRGCAMHQ